MAKIERYRARILDETEYAEGYAVQYYEDKFKPPKEMVQLYTSDNEFVWVDPSTIERVEDGCEYCNGIEKGDLGKALDEVDTEGEMRLYRTAADTWYIRSRRHTDDGDDLFSLFDTDRCFKCGKQLKGVEGK